MLQRAALQSGCQWRVTIRLWGTKARAGRLLPLSAPSPTPTFFRIPDFHLSHGLPAGCPAGSFRLTARISNQVGHKASIQGPSPGYKPPHKGAGQPHNRQTNEQSRPLLKHGLVREHSLWAGGAQVLFLVNFS